MFGNAQRIFKENYLNFTQTQSEFITTHLSRALLYQFEIYDVAMD